MSLTPYDDLGFRLIEYTLTPKKWGYERLIINDAAGYAGKILTVLPLRIACSIHYHKKKIETFHILRGVLSLTIYEPGFGLNQENPVLQNFSKEPHLLSICEGQTIRIPAYHPHRFWANDELVEFIEFSTPDDPADSYRLVESGPIPEGGLKHELY